MELRLGLFLVLRFNRLLLSLSGHDIAYRLGLLATVATRRLRLRGMADVQRRHPHDRSTARGRHHAADNFVHSGPRRGQAHQGFRQYREAWTARCHYWKWDWQYKRCYSFISSNLPQVTDGSRDGARHIPAFVFCWFDVRMICLPLEVWTSCAKLGIAILWTESPCLTVTVCAVNRCKPSLMLALPTVILCAFVEAVVDVTVAVLWGLCANVAIGIATMRTISTVSIRTDRFFDVEINFQSLQWDSVAVAASYLAKLLRFYDFSYFTKLSWINRSLAHGNAEIRYEFHYCALSSRMLINGKVISKLA